MRRLAALGWTFLWIPAVTLGGGMAMIPVMEREFVARRQWLTADEMVDIVSVMQSLPGLVAVNMAVLVGYRVSGLPGALVSAFATVAAPFAAIALIASGYCALGPSPALGRAFLGVRACVAALILATVFRLGRGRVATALDWTLAALGFAASAFLDRGVECVVLLGLAVGLARWFVACGKIRK